jgi:glycosyltransferase involved in cell wall biosynthesis
LKSLSNVKILLLNSLYYPNIVGGAEKSVQLLAESHLAKGHVPIVVTTSNKTYVDYVNGVKVYYIKTPNLYWVLQANEQPSLIKPLWHLVDTVNPLVMPRLRKILSEEQPDIFHSHNMAGFSVSVWRVAIGLRLPIAHTIRDHYLLCPKSEMHSRGKRCGKQCGKCWLFSIPKRRATAAVNAVTGVGKFILGEHINLGYFSKAKLKTHIYNPVRLPPTQANRVGNGKNIIFGYVGMLVQAKGIEFLLERFANMDIPNACLKVYGRGVTEEYETYLRKRFDSSNIRFEGRKDPHEIYSSIDVVIVPSLRDEAFGRIVPEANSYGRPVVVSNRGALPEIVDHGQNGFIFDPNRRGGMEHQIRRILDNPDSIERMGVACRTAASQFGDQRITDQYLAVYRELLA